VSVRGCVCVCVCVCVSGCVCSRKKTQMAGKAAWQRRKGTDSEQYMTSDGVMSYKGIVCDIIEGAMSHL